MAANKKKNPLQKYLTSNEIIPNSSWIGTIRNYEVIAAIIILTREIWGHLLYFIFYFLFFLVKFLFLFKFYYKKKYTWKMGKICITIF